MGDKYLNVYGQNPVKPANTDTMDLHLNNTKTNDLIWCVSMTMSPSGLAGL